MKIEWMTDSDLADMAANMLELLEGTELSSLDPGIRAALAAAIGTRAADLAEQTAVAVALDGEKKAAFSTKNMTRAEVIEWSRQVRDMLKAVRAPKSQFYMCGLDYPEPRANVYHAQDPADLSAVGFSNGVNKLRFAGNNPGTMVVFDIWRREGRDVDWQQHAMTKKQTFEDLGVTPGQYYEYRVRAVAAQTRSNFSNSAIVYGVL